MVTAFVPNFSNKSEVEKAKSTLKYDEKGFVFCVVRIINGENKGNLGVIEKINAAGNICILHEKLSIENATDVELFFTRRGFCSLKFIGNCFHDMRYLF